jgi:hypothetical protein
VNLLHEIFISSDLWIRALQVPGGMLLITESQKENDNGTAIAVASTFVPMSHENMLAFLKVHE